MKIKTIPKIEKKKKKKIQINIKINKNFLFVYLILKAKKPGKTIIRIIPGIKPVEQIKAYKSWQKKHPSIMAELINKVMRKLGMKFKCSCYKYLLNIYFSG